MGRAASLTERLLQLASRSPEARGAPVVGPGLRCWWQCRVSGALANRSFSIGSQVIRSERGSPQRFLSRSRRPSLEKSDSKARGASPHPSEIPRQN